LLLLLLFIFAGCAIMLMLAVQLLRYGVVGVAVAVVDSLFVYCVIRCVGYTAVLVVGIVVSVVVRLVVVVISAVAGVACCVGTYCVVAVVYKCYRT